MSILDKFQDRRENADEEIIDFLSGVDNYNLIFFDTETNGLPDVKPLPSVLSVSAIRATLTKKDGSLDNISIFNRYYFAEEGYNQHALDVNGLDDKTVRRKKFDAHETHGDPYYASFFKEDYDAFKEFCSGVSLFVGHNTEFDMQFLPCIDWAKVRIFDTMQTNADIVCAQWMKSGHWDHGVYLKTPGWKKPKLLEAAKFYGVALEESELHGSLYDAQLTAQIFTEMLKKSTVRLRKFEGQ